MSKRGRPESWRLDPQGPTSGILQTRRTIETRGRVLLSGEQVEATAWIGPKATAALGILEEPAWLRMVAWADGGEAVVARRRQIAAVVVPTPAEREALRRIDERYLRLVVDMTHRVALPWHALEHIGMMVNESVLVVVVGGDVEIWGERHRSARAVVPLDELADLP